MNARHARLSKLVPLAALLLASGLAQGAQPPRVMFVSGLDAKPVLVDPAGKEILAKKGQVIPPGFSVKVPEGATVQIMTDEKAIVAVRQNSLLKLEKLGDGNQPHLLKLDRGGLRVANSDKRPHKFEIDTPNAKVRFDKGDHEAYYFREGNKITEGRWGTFGRSLKGESVLSTRDGDTRVDSTVVGYVPGAGKGGRPEVIDRIKTGDVLSNPVASKMQGASPVSDLNKNQQALSEGAGKTSDIYTPVGISKFGAPVVVEPPRTVQPSALSPVAGLTTKSSMPDMTKVANLSLVRPATVDQLAVKPELSLQKDTLTGKSVPVLKQNSQVSVLATQPGKTQTISIQDVPSTQTTVCLTCKSGAGR